MVGRHVAKSQSYNFYNNITCCDIIGCGCRRITSPHNPDSFLEAVELNGRARRLVRLTVDINQLEVLVAVAQEKSFSRAAETLHRTQPAVSQAIGRLETEIGELLFDRSSKDGTLTAAGRVLFDLAQQVLNMRQNAHTAIRELKDVHRGKLSLSANEYTVMYLLSVLPAFRSRHPHIKVEVKRSLASRIPSEILGRDAEIGIVSFKPGDKAIAAIPVLTDELALIVVPDHPLAQKQVISVRELGAESFIAHNVSSPYRERVIRTFEKYKTPLNISMELRLLESHQRFVELGWVVALVPRLLPKLRSLADRLPL